MQIPASFFLFHTIVNHNFFLRRKMKQTFAFAEGSSEGGVLANNALINVVDKLVGVLALPRTPLAALVAVRKGVELSRCTLVARHGSALRS
jgi:hypothetical protein